MKQKNIRIGLLISFGFLIISVLFQNCSPEMKTNPLEALSQNEEKNKKDDQEEIKRPFPDENSKRGISEEHEEDRVVENDENSTKFPPVETPPRQPASNETNGTNNGGSNAVQDSSGETYYPYGSRRRFAPGLALSLNFKTLRDNPPKIEAGANSEEIRTAKRQAVAFVDKAWNENIEPYYLDWLDPNEKTKMYVYFPNVDLNVLMPEKGRFDFSLIDTLKEIEAVRKGKAKIFIRLMWEKNQSPGWFKNLATDAAGEPPLVDGKNHESTEVQINFRNTYVKEHLLDFFNEFKKRFNRDPDFYVLAFDEVSYSGAPASYLKAKGDIIKNATDLLNELTVMVYQNHGDSWDYIKENPNVHVGTADPKFFMVGCGSSNQSIFENVFDCLPKNPGQYSGDYVREQSHNASIPNPPAGSPRLYVASSEPNGFYLRRGSNLPSYGANWIQENAAGTPYSGNPFKRVINQDLNTKNFTLIYRSTNSKGEKFGTMSEKNEEQNSTSPSFVLRNLYAWYFSGKPRASQEKIAELKAKQEKLGFKDFSKPGVIPAHILVIPRKGECRYFEPENVDAKTIAGCLHSIQKASDWGEILKRFGASGNKSVPALPYAWPDGK